MTTQHDTSGLRTALLSLVRCTGEPIAGPVQIFSDGIVELASVMPQRQINILTGLAQDQARTNHVCFLNLRDNFARVAIELDKGSDRHKYEQWLTALFRLAWLKRIMLALGSVRELGLDCGDQTTQLKHELLQVWFDDGIRFGHEFHPEFKARRPSADRLCAAYAHCESQEDRHRILTLVLLTDDICHSAYETEKHIAPTLKGQHEEQPDTLVSDLSWVLSGNTPHSARLAALRCLTQLGTPAQAATNTVVGFAKACELIPVDSDSDSFILGEVVKTLTAIDREKAQSEAFLCESAEQLLEQGNHKGLNSVLYAMTILARALSQPSIECIKRLLEVALRPEANSEHSREIASTIASRCLQVLLSRNQQTDESAELIAKGRAAFPSDFAYAKRLANP